jgi:hypothetical protein
MLCAVGFTLNLDETKLNETEKVMYKRRRLEEELQKLEKNEFSVVT